MWSTSQKHGIFISEPIGNKPVTEIAGVGEALGKRLAIAGYDKAYVVMGQFLLLKQNKELFLQWMKQICCANNKQALECYLCLNDWCNIFL